MEVRELRAALKVAQDQAAAERKRADEAEAQRKALVQSLAEAVRVSEEQTAASRETELKLQALGVDLISRDGNSLEQRLLKSVRDLDIAQQEIERQSNAIRRLSESCLKVLKAAPSLDAKVRAEAESTLAAANAALAPLAKPKDGPADLSGARVVSVDSSIGLVVFDAGRPTGLRVGTPVTVSVANAPFIPPWSSTCATPSPERSSRTVSVTPAMWKSETASVSSPNRTLCKRSTSLNSWTSPRPTSMPGFPPARPAMWPGKSRGFPSPPRSTCSTSPPGREPCSFRRP